MAKKFKVEGEIVEENEFYKVIKSDENGKFYIFSKYDDTFWTCDKYKIIGTAVLQANYDYKNYCNMLNMQPYGQGRSLAYVIGIDSWKTKVVDGKEQTVVTYYDEKGYKYIRYVDEEGNLYKKQKKIKQEQEETISL